MTRTFTDFRDERIYLDSDSFRNCTFINCEIVYTGGSIDAHDCRFEGCRWSVEGAAANTLAFLELMYMQDGFKELVDITLDRIKGNINWDALNEPEKS
jgi:hypothetical protein